MIHDMQPEDIVGEFREVTLDLYGGIRRKVLYEKAALLSRERLPDEQDEHYLNEKFHK